MRLLALLLVAVGLVIQGCSSKQDVMTDGSPLSCRCIFGSNGICVCMESK